MILNNFNESFNQIYEKMESKKEDDAIMNQIEVYSNRSRNIINVSLLISFLQ